MSRTTTIKNLDEMYWYGVVEATSPHFATVTVLTASAVAVKERSGFASGNTGSVIVFPKYATGSGAGSLGIGSAGSYTITANTPPNMATEVAVPGAATGASYDITVTTGNIGDVFEIYLSPSYSSTHELDWIDDFSAGAVPGKRIETLRGDVDHKKRVFNVEKTMSLTQRFTNAAANLLSLSGMDFTLIGERQDDDGGITSETLFVFSSYHDAGLPTGSVGDNDDTISLEATYNDFCWLAGELA